MLESITLTEAITVAMIGGTLALLGNLGVQWLKSHSESKVAGTNAGVALEKNNQEFSLELVKMAREEIGELAELRKEIRSLRAENGKLLSGHGKLERRISDILTTATTALDHIEAMLLAVTPEESARASAQAQEFYDRTRTQLEKNKAS